MTAGRPSLQPRPLLLLAAACACLLVGLLALEYHSAVIREMRLPRPSAPAASGRATSATREAVLPDPAHVQGWTATILARPLFSASRRPAATVTSGPQQPRLAGIVVGPAGRRAIFAGSGDARGSVVAAGQQAGAWHVVAIDDDSVRVVGPDGPRVLHPSRDDSTHDGAAAAAAGTLPPHPSILDLLRNRPLQLGGAGLPFAPGQRPPPPP